MAKRRKQKLTVVNGISLERRILEIRGEKVIVDADLARIYGVTTKRLNEQVKRNLKRFPSDFAFTLTEEEKTEVVAICDHLSSLKFSAQRPRAFTEHGAIMAANILNSSKAIQMSVFVIRAFIKMRSTLNETRELAKKLAELEGELTGRLDVHEGAIVNVLQRIMAVLDPPPLPPPPPEPPRPEIGFHMKEEAAPYRVKRKSLKRI